MILETITPTDIKAWLELIFVLVATIGSIYTVIKKAERETMKNTIQAQNDYINILEKRVDKKLETIEKNTSKLVKEEADKKAWLRRQAENEKDTSHPPHNR